MAGSNTSRLFRLADRFGTLDNPQIQELLLLTELSHDGQRKEMLSKAFLTKTIQQYTFPYETSIKQHRNERVNFNEVLSKHLLAVGQSGSGKTTLLYDLMESIDEPFWSFDLKQDYRHLIQDRDELLVLPWSEFKFNPLKPPQGVPPRRWIQVFGEIFGHATSLLSGSKNYLMKQLVKLYNLYDLFDRVEPPYPSLGELQLLLEREKINYVRRTSNYRDTVQNRVEALNRTAGTVFKCSQGVDVEELLKRNVVFEFDGLSEDTQNFLMEILIAYVYEYRLAQNQRGGDLRHAFFIDEGKRVFSVYKERREASGLPTIDELTARMREFGEALIVADQEATKLTDSIKANTYTKILLPTGDRKQFNAIADSMNLSERQMEVAQKLSVGEAVVQVGNRDPNLVKLPDYHLDKTVSNNELQKQQQEKWDELTHEPPKISQFFEEEVFSRTSNGESESSDDDQGSITLSRSGKRLLKDVIEDPFKPLTDRYQNFSSRYKGDKAKNELLDNGVVVERRVRQEKAKRKLLQLSEKGRNYVKEELDLEINHDGRGGIVHRFWQHRIQEIFQKAGWDAFLEKFDADVYINMGKTELAVEVAMEDTPREIQHVENHLEKGFEVWIACRNQEIQEGLEQRLKQNNLKEDQVVFRLLRDFSRKEMPSR